MTNVAIKDLFRKIGYSEQELENVPDNIGRIYTIGYAGLGQLGDGSTESSKQYQPYSISDYRFTTEENTENLKTGETKYINPKFEYGMNLITKEFTLNLTYESLDTDVVTVENNKITDAEKNQANVNNIYAQAKSVRALVHFDLVKVYA